MLDALLSHNAFYVVRDVLKFILDNGIKPKVFESPPPAPVATEQKTAGRSGTSSTTLLDETQKVQTCFKSAEHMKLMQ